MLIAWFKDINKDSTSLVGGKGANLGEMWTAGFPIPPGFIVTAEAYKEFVIGTGIQPKILEIVDKIDVDNNEQLQKASKDIQKIILEAEMPADIKQEIITSYDSLNMSQEIVKTANKTALNFLKTGRDLPFVAVRSSATAEDLPEASFAGQQATFLNVKGPEKVVKAVQDCWASLFMARAIYYRKKNNFPTDKVYIAVVIQKMVNSEKAGVMFTINPATNETTELVIEGAYGLGEAVVSGEVNPDEYIVDKASIKIKEKKLKKQGWGYFRSESGTNYKKDFAEEKGSQQKLTDEEILKLAKIGVEIEKHYGRPMDTEWAVDGPKMYIVQARPVTTMKKVKEMMEPDKTDLSKAEVILTGLSASPGIGFGKVKIVHNLDELSKVQLGDILVTKMTSPDMVPAMERAVAIVTDEGGVTCFGRDTVVLTTKGFKSIGETHDLIKEGEELFIFSYDCLNNKPKWKKVLSAGKRKRTCIRACVSQKGTMLHNTIDITPDHKMFTYENRDLIKKEISFIIKENEAVCLVGKLPSFIVQKNEAKLSYLSGALLSDGYFSVDMGKTGVPRRGRVVFTQKEIQSKEIFIATVKNYFHEIFNEEFALVREKHTNGFLRERQILGSATDFICSKMAPAMQMLEISQNLDKWMITLDQESALNFLAGLIDGDGCYYENRLHIYISKENILKGVIIACLKLGIVPQVTTNRTIHHVQILERINDILNYTTRVDGDYNEREIGTRFFSAKQILGDVIGGVNYKGRIRPYVDNNLFIDADKIKEKVIPLAEGIVKNKLNAILNSDIRMHRIAQVEDLGDIEVFNLEVEAHNELDHNYVVFTKKFTPLLVSNSHAAIVSREMGTPCVVGTEKATGLLKDGDEITVDGSKGVVYRGIFNIAKKDNSSSEKPMHGISYAQGELITATRIYMNLGEPNKIEGYKDLPFDGIGLMRIEFIITDYVKEHPLHMIKEGRSQNYIDKLAEGISIVASVIAPKPLIVRFSDFKTNEYANLKGGAEYEPKEDNPMIGWRGVSRYISDEFKPAFRLECKAIKKVRSQGLKNVQVMLPFVRTTWEVEKCLAILEEEGLVRNNDFKIWLMAETPAIALIPEEFASLDIDGASIGSNDLTQGVLCIDRDSTKLGKMGYFDERNPAVLTAIKRIIVGFKKCGKTVSICGQAPSEYPEIVEFLVKNGITSISVNPDVVVKTREIVASVEKKIILEKIEEMK